MEAWLEAKGDIGEVDGSADDQRPNPVRDFSASTDRLSHSYFSSSRIAGRQWRPQPKAARETVPNPTPKHLLHSRPIVEELVLVALTKIQIQDLHRCCFARAAPRDHLLGLIKISPQ
jgi:hypothetical protein